MSRWAFYAPITLWGGVFVKPRLGFHIAPDCFTICLLFCSFGMNYAPVNRNVKKELGRMVCDWKEKKKS